MHFMHETINYLPSVTIEIDNSETSGSNLDLRASTVPSLQRKKEFSFETS